MGENTHRVGRSSRATKPDFWYYDQLPPSAREALANAEHNWSSAWIYNAWSRGRAGYKTGKDCAAQVRMADKKVSC